ncbi:FAD-dependent oxidoreductase [Actinomadura sp. NPDC047616]|uniref:NAD(P)/FAD-dependent oxidoreductase n=1 Tax=Actinomadura sp. NPDC047616 TaxID=3155914 RepID=UPI0033D0EC55
MGTIERVVVAGASLAGLRAVKTLREEGYSGEISLVGAEPHLPYNRPPLSKSVLTGDDDVALPGGDDLDVRWLGGRRAVRLDTRARTVGLDDGTELPYDGLVIATGARPRRLPDEQMSLRGVHVLRTIDDAKALREALAEGAERVVVIGGGFIGGEVASTLRSQGRQVTVVDAGQVPMAGTIGRQAGRWLAGHHARHGVELVSGVRVVALTGEDGRVRAVRLSDGRAVPADLVVVGMGVVPNTEWLDGSGVRVDDGVVTGADLFAEGVSGVVAAGDVARWPHGLFDGELVRVEHWANANEQGAVAARNLLRGVGEAERFEAVPALGTRVHGTRVQWAGFPRLANESGLVSGDIDEGKFALAFTREGVLVGAVAVDLPKEMIRLRKAIAARERLSVTI